MKQPVGQAARIAGAEGDSASLAHGAAEPPAGWTEWVNEAIDDRELQRLKLSDRRGRPYGDERWVLVR